MNVETNKRQTKTETGRMENILIVDEDDKILGTKEKLYVHREGILHRAFSALLINEDGKLLIQRRAFEKYHSGGLYSNSFCSHFYEDEDTMDAIKRAAENELGMDVDNYENIGTVKYFADLGEMSENEIDRIFLIRYKNQNINLNPSEVSEYTWMGVDECRDKIKREPENFTEWFKIIMDTPEIIEKMR